MWLHSHINVVITTLMWLYNHISVVIRIFKCGVCMRAWWEVRGVRWMEMEGCGVEGVEEGAVGVGWG